MSDPMYFQWPQTTQSDLSYIFYNLAGIASQSFWCLTHEIGVPAIFARVTQELEWITTNRQGRTCTEN